MGYAIVLPEPHSYRQHQIFLGRADKFAVRRIDSGLRLSQLHQILPLAPLLFSVNTEFLTTILHQTGLAPPSRLNDQANIGGPHGSLSLRPVAHTCHVFP
jgi:hypothetical protein